MKYKERNEEEYYDRYDGGYSKKRGGGKTGGRKKDTGDVYQKKDQYVKKDELTPE